MSEFRVGISGWTYAPWRGVFYPPKLPHRAELEFASRTFNSIEINGTFYSLQRPTSWAKWAGEVPDDFVFSVKGGRFITHLRRLRECRGALANFLAQGLLTLGPKLGPLLWQLPPTLKFDPELLESFFDLLPRDSAAASALASEHDEKMKGRVAFEIDESRPMRHAIEVRHESFRDAAFVKLLRKHNVALVVADTAGRYPLMDDVTADFVYARLHGDAELYVSGYTDAALDRWAAKCRAWAAGRDAPDARLAGPPAKPRKSRDVYAYFDNDAKVRSPFDAGGLATRLGLTKAAPTSHVDLAEVEGGARVTWPVPVSPRRAKRSRAKTSHAGGRAQRRPGS